MELTKNISQNTLIKCCSGGADPVFVGMDGSSEGYGSIFSQKNYWIGVVAGVVGLMAYQKYVKTNRRNFVLKGCMRKPKQVLPMKKHILFYNNK